MIHTCFFLEYQTAYNANLLRHKMSKYCEVLKTKKCKNKDITRKPQQRIDMKIKKNLVTWLDIETMERDVDSLAEHNDNELNVLDNGYAHCYKSVILSHPNMYE